MGAPGFEHRRTPGLHGVLVGFGFDARDDARDRERAHRGRRLEPGELVLVAAQPHHRRVRALAVTGRARSAQLKDIPTLEESGFKGFDAMQWYGSVGPAGIADDVVRRLNETQVAVLRDPELRDKLSVEAVEPLPMTPEQFGQFIRAEIQRWTALAKAKNIHLDE